jgi:hypothetical protein
MDPINARRPLFNNKLPLMAKDKGKSKGKKSKKNVPVLPKYPPPVVYKTWPGKIEDDRVIAERHATILESNQRQIENELVTL